MRRAPSHCEFICLVFLIIPLTIGRQHGNTSFWSCTLRPPGSGTLSSSAYKTGTLLSGALPSCVLTALNKPGSKMLAPAVGQVIFWLPYWCMQDVYLFLKFSHVIDARFTWELMLCLGLPSLPLWWSPAASVPICTLCWAVYCWVIKNYDNYVAESSLSPHFNSFHQSVGSL